MSISKSLLDFLPRDNSEREGTASAVPLPLPEESAGLAAEASIDFSGTPYSAAASRATP